ncbi:MAG: stage III sporulation protein D [Clostridia bacterium]|nr:stage III sporulation protein D [Clostridia bacterium]
MDKKNFPLIEDVVNYYNSHRSTVRETAQHFGISKSTVHRYITKVMPNPTSEEIININISERGYRGGKASGIARNKYL